MIAMNPIKFCIVALSLLSLTCHAQKRFMKGVYPIGDNPRIGYITTMVPSEPILFEGQPILRLAFYNNITKALLDTEGHSERTFPRLMPKFLGTEKLHETGSTIYASVRPQLRMYVEGSVPVKMPTYRILGGYQVLRKIDQKNFVALSIESGHYSNGQSGCTYNDSLVDGTPECKAIHAAITEDSDLAGMLNRKNGEFSTNMTEVIVNYRRNVFDTTKSKKYADRAHSVKLGYVNLHDKFWYLVDFGGYDGDAVKIYGQHRILAGYEFIKNFNVNIPESELRGRNWDYFSVGLDGEYIFNAFGPVQPFRFEGHATLYLFSGVGFTTRLIYGHDNYNIRLVDSGVQAFWGVSWNSFPVPRLAVADYGDRSEVDNWRVRRAKRKQATRPEGTTKKMRF